MPVPACPLFTVTGKGKGSMGGGGIRNEKEESRKRVDVNG